MPVVLQPARYGVFLPFPFRKGRLPDNSDSSPTDEIGMTCQVPFTPKRLRTRILP